MRRAAASETSPTAPSATIMISFRLCLSATRPPKGEMSPMGSITQAVMIDSMRALSVVSVTYHTTA